MIRISKTSTLFATALALLAPTVPALLTAQEGGAGSEPIGFIELEGIGRFDVFPIAEGISAGKEGTRCCWRARSPSRSSRWRARVR